MSLDISLALPCPLCPSPGVMLTAIYEPRLPSETPLLAEVSGCPHAEEVMDELQGGQAKPEIRLLWLALLHEAEQYCLDLYTDQLEQRSHDKSLREPL